MDLRSVVSASFKMTVHYGLKKFGVEIGATERSSIQKHFSDIVRECISIPDTEVKYLVPPKEKALQATVR